MYVNYSINLIWARHVSMHVHGVTFKHMEWLAINLLENM